MPTDHHQRMTQGVKLFAVTVNWNRPDDTIECARSILTGGYDDIGLVVVDNGSVDDSVEKMRQALPSATLITNPTNEGYVKGVNKGIRMALDAGATHVLVINNDAIGKDHFIMQLKEAMDRHPEAGLVAPKILYYNSNRIWFSGGTFNNWLGYSKHTGMDLINDGKGEESEQDYITGCSILVKADLFRTIGLFDEQYNIYGEDIDFCIRAQDRGFGSWYIPNTIVYHKVSLSTGIGGSNIMTPFRSYYYSRNMLLLVNKRKRGVSRVSCAMGQTFILVPYYFLIISAQRSKGAFRSYLRGYLDALKLVVNDQAKS
jgi:GT2 family glycosyltransferase